MHALELSAPREFRLIEQPEPPPPGPGEALVRVHAVGICGTDLAAWQGKMPFVKYPRILGHELGVEVIGVGEGVTSVKVGDRCSVEPYIDDPNSFASRKGRPNCCEKLEVLGVHCDGGMRRKIVVPARKLHPATKLLYEQLALVETLAIGRHAVQRGQVAEDDVCLVIGAGPIGLAVLEFVRLSGAQMIVMDKCRPRLAFVRQMFQAVQTLEPSARTPDELRSLASGNLPSVVLDATGSPGSMSAAFSLVAHGGRLVYVGITGEEIRFTHSDFHRREGTLVCTRNALPEDFSAIIGLIEGGRIDTRRWITHRTTLERLPAEFPQYLEPETGVVKAVVGVS
ncbi:MAG TPA: zinc-binding alcohol dehydrogenase family protein [Pirellulaceae bacterium]|nr:zinc-binding alcohol dehydrogenase family protein [Pirellulaceae bacterium]